MLSSLSPPSPDSAGIAYLPNEDRFYVSDSEVDEMTIYQGANLYELTRSGTLTDTGTSLPWSDEPTGAGYDATTNRLLISDDDANRITFVLPGSDGRYGTGDDTTQSFNVNGTGNADAEDVAFDATRNQVLVVDGVNMEVYRYTATGTFINSFDLGVYGAADPEGIAFDQANDLIIVVDQKSKAIYELNNAGGLVRSVGITAANSYKAAGVEIAPASNNSGASHYYVVDRGVDNDGAPTENDGKMYEFDRAGLSGGTVNQAPVVGAGSDAAIQLPAGADLVGTASDDGLPSDTLTTTWSKTSGPGTVTFGNASALSTTATFSASGSYVLRLTASDGARTSFDEVTITVSNADGTQTLTVPISGVNDDIEQNLTTNTLDHNGDLELGVDGTTAQMVGLRFQGVAIPQGATISNAYVQFTADETNSQPADINIRGQAADSAAAFATTLSNLTNRAQTTAVVNWVPAFWPTIGAATAAQATPDITTVIQEIVSRPGWVSGNALALLITGSGKRTAEAYEGGAAVAAVLHLTYTTGPPPVAPPAAPSGIVLTNAGANVGVSWTDNSSTETGFEVQRGRWDAASGVWVEWTTLPSVGANVTSTTDVGVADGRYAYVVRAVNLAGPSAWLTGMIDHSSSPPPAAPSGIVLTNAGANVGVSWTDNSSTETGFEVQRGRWDAASGVWVEWTTLPSVGANVTSTTDVGVADGRYAYVVRAVNLAGPSAWLTGMIDHSSSPPPAAPSGIVLTNAGANVGVSWTDNSSNETGFEVQRGRWDAASGVWVEWTTLPSVGANVTSTTDVGVADGRYAYVVRAVNLAGPSAWLTGMIDHSSSPPPAAPSGIVLTNAGANVGVSWTDNSSNETGFEVQRGRWDAASGVWVEWTTLPSVGANVTSTTDVGVADGRYAYVVRAVNLAGPSAWLTGMIDHNTP